MTDPNEHNAPAQESNGLGAGPCKEPQGPGLVLLGEYGF